MNNKPHAIIIGGGFTGCAVAHDLALRGFAVTLLERGELTSGTSGRTHGLLHSGARYCVNDSEAAIECIEENIILRKIAAQCVVFNQGLYVALNDEDMAYAPLFEKGAAQSKIETIKLTPKQALDLEPALNPKVLLAYKVPDGTFDPLRLAFAFAASAHLNGAELRPYHEVEGFLKDGQGNVTGVKVWDRTSNKRYELNGDITINATGAWAGQVSKMLGINTAVIPTPGVMVAYDQRVTQRVINRLNMPGDGDIIIPQRRMAVIGTTSFEVENPDYIPITEDQVQLMHKCAEELVPALKNIKVRGIYMSARPLIKSATAGRSLSRTFKCYDHKANEGMDGIVSIIGGKATTSRVMAEKTSDLVCQKLGIKTECRTHDLPLASYRDVYRV
ncbi:MAG TPA: FAD-dependent oxidoreductase [Anaerolineaceae bacterium]|nr:FAD-dependent oxidoreductase [Anaerolineaceae bacterium]